MNSTDNFEELIDGFKLVIRDYNPSPYKPQEKVCVNSLILRIYNGIWVLL